MRGRRSPHSTMLALVNLDERVPPERPPSGSLSRSLTTSSTDRWTTSTGCTRRSVGLRSLPSIC